MEIQSILQPQPRGSRRGIQAVKMYQYGVNLKIGHPLVKTDIAIEHGHRIHRFIQWKWWFSIAMLVITRGYGLRGTTWTSEKIRNDSEKNPWISWLEVKSSGIKDSEDLMYLEISWDQCWVANHLLKVICFRPPALECFSWSGWFDGGLNED